MKISIWIHKLCIADLLASSSTLQAVRSSAHCFNQHINKALQNDWVNSAEPARSLPPCHRARPSAWLASFTVYTSVHRYKMYEINGLIPSCTSFCSKDTHTGANQHRPALSTVRFCLALAFLVQGSFLVASLCLTSAKSGLPQIKIKGACKRMPKAQ